MSLQFGVKVQTIEARQQQVEHNHVGQQPRIDLLQGVNTIGNRRHEETGLNEFLSIEFAKCIVILNDEHSQRIAMLSTEIDTMAAQTDSEATRARLRVLSARTCDIATDVHDMSYALHPSWLKTLGLVSAVQSLCRDASKQRSLRVSFTHSSIPRTLDGDISLCVYRIVQEALHNIARHSQAEEANVNIACNDGHITLQIADAGVGFDPRHLSSASLGLASIRERVAVLKGRLSIDAARGGGTQITVHIPLA